MKQFQRFGLDTANQCLLRDGAPVGLAPKPFAVLRYLVENPGRLITHDELLDKLWPETFVQPQVLRTYMLELRKVLGDDAASPQFIQTLPKRGYRFVAAVTEPGERTGAAVESASTSETQPPPRIANGRPAAPLSRGVQIVGRDAELAWLDAQLRQASARQRQMAFVSGDPGIGKTALVDAFCAAQAQGSANIGRGQCVQWLGSSEEYYPVTEALNDLCAGTHGDAARRALADLAPEWLGRSREAEASPASAAIKERSLGELFAALEQMAQSTPLILILEDAHWADECTLNLISALARRRNPARLLVLLTHCPRQFLHAGAHPEATDDALRALKQDLLMRRMCVERVLTPLKKPAVEQLCGKTLQQADLPAGLADFVHRRSEGNPLFVHAILDHMLTEGVLVPRQPGGVDWAKGQPFAETDESVPEQLARMIELQIERLSDQERRLLEAASLMEVAFPAWAVAAALEQDPVETEEACDGMARRLHFVLRAGQDELPDGSCSAFYVFAHGLYREVLYRRQAATRRARRHIRIAQRLGELFAGREAAVARERAMHYQAAGDHAMAARVLAQAEPMQMGAC